MTCQQLVTCCMLCWPVTWCCEMQHVQLRNTTLMDSTYIIVRSIQKRFNYFTVHSTLNLSNWIFSTLFCTNLYLCWQDCFPITIVASSAPSKHINHRNCPNKNHCCENQPHFYNSKTSFSNNISFSQNWFDVFTLNPSALGILLLQ